MFDFMLRYLVLIYLNEEEDLPFYYVKGRSGRIFPNETLEKVMNPTILGLRSSYELTHDVSVLTACDSMINLFF